MASWEGAEQGAMQGASTGNPWMAAGLALLGGLFGHKQSLSPEQKFQMDIANQMKQFGNSVPLSDPGEQGMLAQQRGMLGEEQRNQQNEVFASMPGNATTSIPDMMKNLTSQQVGQRMALSSQALMNALMSRRQALMQAANVAQGVGPRQQQPGIGGDLASFYQMYSQYQASRGANQAAAGGGGGSGGGITPNTIYSGGGVSAQSTPGQAGGSPLQGVTPNVPSYGGPTAGGIMGNQGPNFSNGLPLGGFGQAPPNSGYGMPTNNGRQANDNEMYKLLTQVPGQQWQAFGG